MSDAVIALTANVAIKRANEGKGGYIEFKEEWYDIDDDATPDGSVVADEMARLTKNA